MRKKEKNELAVSKIILVIIAAVTTLITVWFAWVKPDEQTPTVTTYKQCVDAGYPVREIYPEVCVTPDGTTFTNPTQKSQSQ